MQAFVLGHTKLFIPNLNIVKAVGLEKHNYSCYQKYV